MTIISEISDKGAVVAWSPRVEHADVIALGSKVRYLYIIIAVCFLRRAVGPGGLGWIFFGLAWLQCHYLYLAVQLVSIYLYMNTYGRSTIGSCLDLYI